MTFETRPIVAIPCDNQDSAFQVQLAHLQQAAPAKGMSEKQAPITSTVSPSAASTHCPPMKLCVRSSSGSFSLDLSSSSIVMLAAAKQRKERARGASPVADAAENTAVLPKKEVLAARVTRVRPNNREAKVACMRLLHVRSDCDASVLECSAVAELRESIRWRYCIRDRAYRINMVFAVSSKLWLRIGFRKPKSRQMLRWSLSDYRKNTTKTTAVSGGG